MYYDLPPDKPIVFIEPTFLKKAEKYTASNDPFKHPAQHAEGFGGFLSYSGTANAS